MYPIMKGLFWEDGILKISYVCDEHFPIQCNEAIEWTFNEVEDFKPHIMVFGGDAYDGEAWSRWNNDNDWDQYEEYVSVARYFQRFNDMDFIKKKIWMYGNHEDNLFQPDRVKKSQRPMLDWKAFDPPGEIALRDVVKDWQVIRAYGSDVHRNIGSISFTHGTKIGQNAARDEALAHAPHMGLCVSGHTHKPVPVTRITHAGGIPGDVWYANAGTSIDPRKAKYMKRSMMQGWGRGIVNIEIHSRDATLVNEGRKIFRTKVWEAETRIKGIYRDTIHGRG
jgi:predicted phosphodiesterase